MIYSPHVSHSLTCDIFNRTNTCLIPNKPRSICGVISPFTFSTTAFDTFFHYLQHLTPIQQQYTAILRPSILDGLYIDQAHSQHATNGTGDIQQLINFQQHQFISTICCAFFQSIRLLKLTTS
eukprot:UN01217